MKPLRENHRSKKPTWTAQIVMLLLAALFLWLMGTGIIYLFRFVMSQSGNL